MAVTKVNDWTWVSDRITDTKFKTKRDAYAAEADLEFAPPEVANPAAKQTAAATAARRLDSNQCSGKWSTCGGRGTRKSASWGLCQECTDARKTVKASDVQA